MNLKKSSLLLKNVSLKVVISCFVVFLRNDGPHSQLQCILYLKHPVTEKKSEEGNETGKSSVLLFPNPFVTAYCKTCALLHLFFRVVMLLIYGCMMSLPPILFYEICKKGYLYFSAETVSGPLVMYLGPTMYIYLMSRITILVGTNWIIFNCTTEISRGGCSISSV